MRVEVSGGQVEFLGGLPPDIHRTIIGNIADPFLAIDMGSEVMILWNHMDHMDIA